MDEESFSLYLFLNLCDMVGLHRTVFYYQYFYSLYSNLHEMNIQVCNLYYALSVVYVEALHTYGSSI